MKYFDDWKVGLGIQDRGLVADAEEDCYQDREC